MKKEDKTALIEYLKDRYLESISEIDLLIKENHFHLAVTRIYYGMYYLVTILALLDNYVTGKHAQLIGWFNPFNPPLSPSSPRPLLGQERKKGVNNGI